MLWHFFVYSILLFWSLAMLLLLSFAYAVSLQEGGGGSQAGITWAGAALIVVFFIIMGAYSARHLYVSHRRIGGEPEEEEA